MDSPILKFIKTYWFIIVFLISLVTGWVNFTNADNMTDKRLTAIENQHKDLTATQTTIQVQLSQIQTDLQWIKAKLK